MENYIRRSLESVSSSVTDAWHAASSSNARSITNKMAYYSSGGLGNLPNIPCNIQDENVALLAISGYRFAQILSTKLSIHDTKSTAWGSCGLTAILGLLHVERLAVPKSTSSAFETSMNPYRVLEKHELYRLISSQAYHASTTSFLTYTADLCESASVIESIWGWQGMIASVSFTSLLGQMIYIGSTYLANTWYPASDLAREFYRFSSGLSITTIGVKTLAGYLMDGVEMSRMHAIQRGTMIWSHRYQWSMQLLLTGALLKISSRCMEQNSTISPYVSLELPSVYASASGVIAGVITSYIFDGPWIRPSLGLCCADIALQSVLLGLSIFSLRTM